MFRSVKYVWVIYKWKGIVHLLRWEFHKGIMIYSIIVDINMGSCGMITLITFSHPPPLRVTKLSSLPFEHMPETY